MTSLREIYTGAVPIIFLVGWCSWDIASDSIIDISDVNVECTNDICYKGNMGKCSKDQKTLRSLILKQNYTELQSWLSRAVEESEKSESQKKYYMDLLGFRESTPVQDRGSCNDLLPLQYCARNGDVQAASMIHYTLSKELLGDIKPPSEDEDDMVEQFNHKDLANYPKLNGSSLAHIAAKNGHLDFLRWIQLRSDGFAADFALLDSDSKLPLSYLMSEHTGGNDTYMEWMIKYLQADRYVYLGNETWAPSLFEWYLDHLSTQFTELGELMKQPGLIRDAMFNGTLRMQPKNAEKLADHPPLYKFNNLFSEEVVESVRETAKPLMRASGVGGQSPVPRRRINEFLKQFDGDNDTMLNRTETRGAMLGLLSREVGSFKDKSGGQQLNCSKAAQLLFIDRNHDGNISLDGTEDFNVNETNMTQFETNMKAILKVLESRVVRTSTVTFIPKWHDAVQRVHDIASEALGLPRWFMKHAEDLQVVHYKQGQHYGNHMDSANRVATLFIYLNKPDAGGETAFPWAGAGTMRELAKARPLDDKAFQNHPLVNATLSPECKEHFNCCNPGCRLVDGTKCMGRMKVREYRECMAKNAPLITHGLAVPPATGSAVLWYNYEHAPGSRKLEIADSTHCGCDSKGDKWGANIWLRQPDATHVAYELVERVAIARHIARKIGHDVADIADDSYDVFLGLSQHYSNDTEKRAAKKVIDAMKKDFGLAVLSIPIKGENAALSEKLWKQSPAVFDTSNGLKKMPNAKELLWGALWWDLGFLWDDSPEMNLQGRMANQCR
eukprot:gnl/MRDRNA2_/MRDRNA2_105748_c0_seq1.p1 gnl/MRDRNA2_/MRDRNA2_105748_c0~~gnl/MRDRNA2_/MRDRNA2_105748_c0_seq1.p1  ORF type:complete len:796 (-),score=142.55 gnl/MRDRNA2_/MRDRNA2_105748_c0_seq1:99-2447(-)